MAKLLTIHTDLRVQEGITRYTADLEYFFKSSRLTLYYELGPETAKVAQFNPDGILQALLFHAMRSECGIRLKGTASLETLLNLHELQLAWNRWLPQDYRVIDIECDHVGHGAKASGGAIAAYSGGVDAIFTLLTHAVPGRQPHRDLRACLLVHGFDIPSKAESAFGAVHSKARELHEYLGVDTFTIKTNSKELDLQHWDHSFSAQLSACLQMFSRTFGQGLIGSSQAYDELVIPSGSTPITDHLLSGAAMQIIHDGSGFPRTEKIARIAKHPAALRSLRVCWEGKEKDRNCGRCEKCVRTMLGLLAAGIEDPECFPKRLELQDIDSMVIRTRPQLAQLKSIISYAERNGASGEWLQRLKKRHRAGRNLTARGIAKATLEKLGLLDAVRKRMRPE